MIHVLNFHSGLTNAPFALAGTTDTALKGNQMDTVFNMDEAVELLKASYKEAERLRIIAWDRLSDAMIAASPVKVGDRILLQNQFYTRDNGKTIQITRLRIIDSMLGYRTLQRGQVLQAEGYPLKKDGTPARTGKWYSRDISRELKESKIVLV